MHFRLHDLYTLNVLLFSLSADCCEVTVTEILEPDKFYSLPSQVQFSKM